MMHLAYLHGQQPHKACRCLCHLLPHSYKG
uniref:Ubiquitin carboxyl-terminal hydrolase 18-like n=1 Tax=Rhizophora mucronata TaxID=61149 RepID=A0A2P2LAN0_RHIMU